MHCRVLSQRWNSRVASSMKADRERQPIAGAGRGIDALASLPYNHLPPA